jgi:hypothetical protein
MYAECAGVSGRGYYAAGPLLDVQDVPHKVTAVLYVLCVGGLPDPRLRAVRLSLNSVLVGIALVLGGETPTRRRVASSRH